MTETNQFNGTDNGDFNAIEQHTPVISGSVLNTEKNSYEAGSLFMGEQLGLMDSLHIHYPALYKLYKEMKSKDWDELEFKLGSSTLNTEFKTCPKDSYEIMIRTLAWQWETDTAAARSIVRIISPFVTNDELFYGWQRIADNEVVHALTYSEIVKNSFDDPTEVLKDILKIKESLSRLELVAEIFDRAIKVGAELTLGIRKKDAEAYDTIFMFVVALYCLEAIQFMASFAITFAMGNSKQFVPAVMPIQKIAIDEFFVHKKWDRTVLDIELSNEHGLMAFSRNRSKILALINSIVQAEMSWNAYTFSEGREQPGLTQDLLDRGVLFYAKEVYEFFGFRPDEIPYTLPVKNPLTYMNDWLNIDSVQVSPMEQKSGNYVLGMIAKDVGDDEKFDDNLG